jgi:hypothetical protein
MLQEGPSVDFWSQIPAGDYALHYERLVATFR